MQIQHPGLIGHQRLIGAAVDLHIVWVGLVGLLPIGNGGKHAGVADLIGGVHLIDDGGQVIGTQHHVLRRHSHGPAVRELQQVIGRQHQEAGLGLRLGGKRHMHRHLVAVEVGIECGTNQRMQLQGAALHQNGLECLDTQTVQGRRSVHQHGVALDDHLQRVPNLLGGTTVHHFAGLADILSDLQIYQTLHYKGLKELQRHLLGQAALVHLQLGAHHDNGTAGIVYTLTQQVLAEAALLTLQHIAQGLECTVVGAGHRAAAAAVIDEGVHRLLQHPLLVTDDDIGGVQLQQLLQAVVAVDDPAIQVIEVAGGKAAAIQLYHGADIGRDDRQYIQDHPLWLVAAGAERFHHIQALEQLRLLLAGGLLQLFLNLNRERLNIQLLQQLLYRLGAHTGIKFILIGFPVLVILPLTQQGVLLQLGVAGIDDDIGCEIQHLFQHTGAQVQQQAHAAAGALKVPDVGNGRSQLNVAHPFAAHLGAGHFHAAALADLALKADTLILAAVAFPVLSGSKNALAEQAVALRL